MRQLTAYRIHIPDYSVHITEYSVYLTGYSVQLAQYSERCTLNSVKCVGNRSPIAGRNFTHQGSQSVIHELMVLGVRTKFGLRLCGANQRGFVHWKKH